MRSIFYAIAMVVAITSNATSRTADENPFDLERQKAIIEDLCKEGCFEAGSLSGPPWTVSKYTIEFSDLGSELILEITETAGQITSVDFSSFQPQGHSSIRRINLNHVELLGMPPGKATYFAQKCNPATVQYCDRLTQSFSHYTEGEGKRRAVEFSVLIALAKGWSPGEIFNSFCNQGWHNSGPGNYDYDWCQSAGRIIGDPEELKNVQDPIAIAKRQLQNRCGIVEFDENWINRIDLSNDGLDDLVIRINTECRKWNAAKIDSNGNEIPWMEPFAYERIYVRLDENTWRDAEIFSQYEISEIAGKTVLLEHRNYCGIAGTIESEACRSISLWGGQEFLSVGDMHGDEILFIHGPLAQ